MKGRIYLSEDEGACALIAAALDVWPGRKGVPTGGEVAAWAAGMGMEWSQGGRIWPAGVASEGRAVFFCGVGSRSSIVERALHCLMPMLGISPLDWELIRLRAKAPRVCSWSRLIREYPRLSRLIREELVQ